MITIDTIQPSISNTSTITDSLRSPKVNSMAQTTASSPISIAHDSKYKHLNSIYLQFINENNHLGLATLARQYGVPSNLRYKVWPILLKYHPYVIEPFIDATVQKDTDLELDLNKVTNDLNKYFKIRSSSSSNDHDNTNNKNNNNIRSSPNEIIFSPIEEEIIRIIKASIIKFFNKWGAIVKYDSGFTWIALNLAEWFPPIPNSNYVLIGKNYINKNDSLNKHLTQIIDSTTNQEFNLDDDSYSTYSTTSSTDSGITPMTFSEVFERLVLVLLHSHDDNKNNDENNETNNLIDPNNNNNLRLTREEIVFKSGKVENRLQFFINALSKLQPELFKLLSDDEYLLSNNKSSSEWLTWWLKYCGAKILNKNDRGRLWDLLLGFRLNFKAFSNRSNQNPNSKQSKLFKKFYNDESFKDNDLFKIDEFWYITSDDTISLKWSQIDYQFQLVFIFISILQKNESKLLEIDQSEMIEFLSNLNFKDSSNHLINNYLINEFNNDNNSLIQKAIIEAGDLWRNWLWHELHDEINE